MRVLLCNDDGVFADGMQTLINHLAEHVELYIVAPDRNRSGAAHSLTLDAPLRVNRHGENCMSVEGTPVDCIHLALTGLLNFQPDLVISGINGGANLGDDVLYSGTVAAAIEGSFFKVPAVAVSLVGQSHHKQTGLQNYESASEVVLQLIRHIEKAGLFAGTVLNVNIPDKPFPELGEIEFTRLGTRKDPSSVVHQVDPRGRDVYWIGVPGAEDENGPGTDFHALANNNVSVTPIQIDLTHHEYLAGMGEWGQNLVLNQTME